MSLMIDLDAVAVLECGCEQEFWKLLLHTALMLEQGRPILCPAHNILYELGQDGEFRKIAQDFLAFARSPKGKEAFPDLFRSC